LRKGDSVRVSNTLSGKKEEFTPQDDEVKMYVCGVTPYDDAHIGHAMSYIIFDVIRRYLRFRGYKVKYVQNVTDIDDKIISRANERGIPPHELAEQYTSSFHEDMEALNIMPPDVEPRATEMINSENKDEITIIKVIEGLINKGHAYEVQGSVYFRVNSAADYGKLAHRSLEQMMAGARIEVDENKEHPMDFLLWKASKPGEPSWDSPWGQGRPGWHIECSAMSLKYLGETLDIHGGGQDLIFPHHENEIAQSESFTGVKPFVRFWLHNGLLQLGQEKMSKSLGNLITIKEALAKYSADAIRIFVLSSHYRSPLTYSEEALEAAERGADRLRQTISEKSGEKEPEGEMVPEHYQKQFIEAMDNDFNTPKALAVLFDLAHDINRISEAGFSVAQAQQVLVELSNVLGLNFGAPPIPPLDVTTVADSLRSILTDVELNLGSIEQEIHSDVKSTYERAKRSADIVYELTRSSIDEDLERARPIGDIALEGLINLRQDFRASKLYDLADKIRDGLGKIGIALEDTPKGTVWKRKR
jgi:cysteinyl-tRNA synthetase